MSLRLGIQGRLRVGIGSKKGFENAKKLSVGGNALGETEAQTPHRKSGMDALMTKLLKQAFDRATKLTDDEQDALASVILEELADERRWAMAFKGSRTALDRLAKEAIEDLEQGRTTPLDPDNV
jgi:hypothetical protein